jgi:thiamine-phosphate pyrophosphorylase
VTPLPRLVLITDFARGEAAVLAAIERALSAGPGLAVQLRYPAAQTRTVFELGEKLKVLCDRAGAMLFASARVDLARALDCHLHLPASALRPSDVRAALGAGKLISCAVHDAEEAERAHGADFALVSPVWPAGSKHDDPRTPLGEDGYRALAAKLACPAYALGGVTPERLKSLRPPGAAVVSYVLSVEDPAAAARELLRHPFDSP